MKVSNQKDYYISDDELARRLGVEQKSVAVMIKKYKESLEELGEIITEEQKTSAGQSRKYRLLTTREQYYLLVFYAKNTEKSVKLKAEVVKEMFMLRDKLLAGD